MTSATGDVVLVQDQRTGLVFNAAYDASRLRYDGDYQNEQACSPIFREHLEKVASIIGVHFDGQRLLEVGCGKGYFLQHLRRLNHEVSGLDPAYEGDSGDVIKASFEPGMRLSADAVILRHVLEHIADPLTFLAAIAEANGGRGSIYIEVPCFEWILERRAWFDIFYEHVNYFRLADFWRMFGHVLESGHVFGGQYLYVVADLASLRRPEVVSPDRLAMPADFLSGIDRTVAMIRDCGDKQNALWGAASKGVIFSIYMQRAGIAMDGAIDINPVKQGRFLACSGLRISSPAEASCRLKACDNVFVMNSNYLDEIVSQSEGRYTYCTVEHG
ncbi:MAG: class I SAM-dependent methyltransferase [Luteimonas sp.]